MRALKVAAAALFGLVVSACIPEFENPVTGGEPADPALVGKWRAAAEGDEAEMLLDITAASGGLTVVMTDPSAEADDKMTFAGVTGKVGDMSYISLKLADQDRGGQPGYLVFRYWEEDGKIHVVSLDEQKIAAAIASGALKGTTTGSGTDTASKVSASSDEIAAFFATPDGQAAFRKDKGDILILTRAAP